MGFPRGLAGAKSGGMIQRIAQFILLCLLAPAVVAQPAEPIVASAEAVAPKAAVVRVALLTSEGPIVLELEKERAPITAANFLRYVDQKRFDGASFYRAVGVPGAPEYGLVQGGVRFDPRKTLPAIAHEPTTKTGLSHLSGTISMARNAPGTATGDFFITIGDMPYMDADPKQPGDNVGYAAFGRVAEGMDIVRRILAAPVSPTEGVGSMRGQILAAPIRILSARRIPG